MEGGPCVAVDVEGGPCVAVDVEGGPCVSAGRGSYTFTGPAGGLQISVGAGGVPCAAVGAGRIPCIAGLMTIGFSVVDETRVVPGDIYVGKSMGLGEVEGEGIGPGVVHGDIHVLAS